MNVRDIPSEKIGLARRMARAGATLEEIAAAIDVPLTPRILKAGLLREFAIRIEPRRTTQSGGLNYLNPCLGDKR